MHTHTCTSVYVAYLLLAVSVCSSCQAAKEKAERDAKAHQDMLANIQIVNQAVARGEVFEMDRDGNCLPKAIAQHKYGDVKYHGLAREEVREVIVEEWGFLEPFAVNETTGEQMTLDEVLEKSELNEWLGEFGLFAAALFLKARVKVYCDSGKYPPPIEYPAADSSPELLEPTCHLLRTNSSHYDLLIISDDSEEEDVSEEEKDESESEEESESEDEEEDESESDKEVQSETDESEADWAETKESEVAEVEESKADEEVDDSEEEGGESDDESSEDESSEDELSEDESSEDESKNGSRKCLYHNFMFTHLGCQLN